MRTSRGWFLLVLLVATCAATARAEEEERAATARAEEEERAATARAEEEERTARYAPTTIAALREEWLPTTRVARRFVTDHKENQYALPLTYLATRRDRTPGSEDVIQGLTSFRETTCKCDVHFLENYLEEVLFREGTQEHWLVVHRKVLKRMRKELKSGDAITLRVRWAGALDGDFVFLVKDFRE